ncbi:phosphatidate cytidylyltransferase [Rhodopseudomonas sp. B29]|uniref:phosphatidate cytidylyltransferase n=2 Tax=Rhodopseudomonas sp. B29 TaxID=95607 RepID=UPI00034DF290|nr:phosphatidate cytidylyltransferase [Rhodopseudomonas sp. B29]
MSQDEPVPAATAEQGGRNLLLRTAAAMVLAPSAIALAYIGGWPWAVLAMLVAVGLLVEWFSIVGFSRDWPSIGAGAAALLICGLALAAGRPWLALAAAALGFAALAALGGTRRRWSMTGFVYAALALAASILVRADEAWGFTALMLVLLIVWVTDIGGYFAGRSIGGPKLWVRVSPKKTWAGAVGGFVLSLLVGLGFALLGFGKTVPLLIVAAVLSVVSQLGDLFESAVKRQFGVKDSSHIIPGHGGLLDRLDGYVAAVVVAVLIGLCRDSLDGVGRGLMVW